MKFITLPELMLIQLIMGSITYLLGSIVFFLYLRKIIIPYWKKILLMLLQLCIAYIFSLFIWGWGWNIINRFVELDILIGFINIPSLIAETLTILIFLLCKKNVCNENLK